LALTSSSYASPGHRAYTVTQNSPFSYPAVDVAIASRAYLLRFLTEGWPGWVGVSGWLVT